MTDLSASIICKDSADLKLHSDVALPAFPVFFTIGKAYVHMTYPTALHLAHLLHVACGVEEPKTEEAA